jgi:D-alanine transaminase
MPDILWINGRFTTTDEPVIRVEDRGFQFGDGVYEVFKFLGHRPIFLPEHFARMQRGLGELEIANPWSGLDAFSDVVQSLLERTSFDDGIVYIQVTRGAGERSHFYADDLMPTAVVYSRNFRFPDAAKKERGIRVITTPDLRWKRCDVKSVNLLANALAKKKAQRARAEEVVLVDEGLVREGASSNFFAVRRGSIVTHPLDPHILPGVVRDRVIALALSAKVRVDERPLREAELFDLDEAFITSTTNGVLPVTVIDGRNVGSGRCGEVTRVLQSLFDGAERLSAPCPGAAT